jgi:hypothetical protein
VTVLAVAVALLLGALVLAVLLAPVHDDRAPDCGCQDCEDRADRQAWLARCWALAERGEAIRDARERRWHEP